MLKEIYEQPEPCRDTLLGRFDGNGRARRSSTSICDPARITRVIITACGTACHAAMVGEYLIERLARIPVEVEWPASSATATPWSTTGTLCVAVSPVGRDRRHPGALREAQAGGARKRWPSSTRSQHHAARPTACIYIHAGPEIGVASTKAFSARSPC